MITATYTISITPPKFQRTVIRRGGQLDVEWAPRTLAVDRGGVGLPVVQLLERKLPPDVEMRAVYVHAGNAVTNPEPHLFNIPKRDLISAAVTAFQTGQLLIAGGVTHARQLEQELKMFRRKISESGRDSYEGGGSAHDDLVFCLALAVWAAGHGDEGRIEPVSAEIAAAFDWL